MSDHTILVKVNIPADDIHRLKDDGTPDQGWDYGDSVDLVASMLREINEDVSVHFYMESATVSELSCDRCGTTHNQGWGSLNVRYIDEHRVCYDCYSIHAVEEVE
jgi:hypothetical protein